MALPLRIHSSASPVTAVRPKLVVVVPAYNEEKNITRVIRELQALELPGCDLDFVIVNDGSRDRTDIVAREAGASVVSLPFNMGIGVTVQTGFRYALSGGADFVAQIDGDCQHIPSELTKLLAPIREGRADVVIGSRFSSDEKGATQEGIRSTTLLRWLVGRALSLNIRILTGLRVTDTTSGFRLFNERAARYVAESYPDDYPEVQILVPLACEGFRVIEVPVQMRPRMAGESSINWYRAVYYVLKVTLASLLDRVRGPRK